jgi:hypothetical protein
MGMLSLHRRFVALATFFASFGIAATALAEAIPPDELFFAPSSLVEGLYPTKSYSGDGTNAPWTIVWTTKDVTAIDPRRVDITITGISILPVLRENPNTVEGEYEDADLAAITVDNYAEWYGLLPGLSVDNLNCSYDADLSDNVMVVRIVSPGPYTFRLHTTSRPGRGAALEEVDYHYSVLIGDAYALLSDAEPVPAHVQRRMSVDETSEGVAGDPPGVVHVVSDGDPNDNMFLSNACETLTDQGKDPKKANSVQKVIDRVCAAQVANGGNPVKLVLHAHGNGPAGGATKGLMKIGTEFICNNGCTKSPKQFGEALKGKVSSITLSSCYVGSDAAFTQALADASNVTISSYKVAVTCAKKSTYLFVFTSAGYFDTAAKGTKKKTEPHGCTSGFCVGDLSADGAVDAVDLAHLLRLWGEAGCADLNDDGNTNSDDLAILLAAWGPCP